MLRRHTPRIHPACSDAGIEDYFSRLYFIFFLNTQPLLFTICYDLSIDPCLSYNFLYFIPSVIGKTIQKSDTPPSHHVLLCYLFFFSSHGVCLSTCPTVNFIP